VERVTDGRGRVVKENGTRVRREVVSPGVARMVADMLTAVTEPGGTAKEAAVPGFRVAGKTSTAQKVDPATGKYSQENYTAVFTGFVPAEHPRLVITVVLDEPMIGHYGGDLAGPVFRRVAEASLRYLGVTPSGTDHTLATVTREGDPADETIAAMRGQAPDPLAGASASASADAGAGAGAGAGAVPAGQVRVPDAVGLGAHDAVLVMTRAGLLPEIDGSGRMTRQEPAPGTPVPKGTAVRLVFEPPS
jgi:cell division protein FtsI (penicillin-binding protein 3)